MNRNGELAIVDDAGRERERYAVIYGAKLIVEGRRRRCRPRRCSSEWDPFSMPILTEVAGIVKYGDIIDR